MSRFIRKLACIVAVTVGAVVAAAPNPAQADYIITAPLVWFHGSDTGSEQILLDSPGVGSCVFDGKFIASLPESSVKETMTTLTTAALLSGRSVRVKTSNSCTLIYVRLE